MESDQEDDFRAGWDDEGNDSEVADAGLDNELEDDEFLLHGDATADQPEGLAGWHFFCIGHIARTHDSVSLSFTGVDACVVLRSR